MAERQVPLYRYDGALVDWISPKRAERLAVLGRAKVVRHKMGAINRVILHRMPGKPAPPCLIFPTAWVVIVAMASVFFDSA